MSEKEELSDEEVSEDQGGVLLGLWDYEKTPTLIQELEHSVDLIERKCKNLVGELMYYKRYLEESEDPGAHLDALKKKDKKPKNSHFLSGSDPDLAFRKNLINLQKTQQIFEEKFQEKIMKINGELRAAGQKLGLCDSVVLFATDDYLSDLNKQAELKARKSWSDVRDKFIKLNCSKAKTKSDSVIADIGDTDQIAKITKNELELYQRLSRLSLRNERKIKPKVRKMVSFKAKKFKFCCRKAGLQLPRSSKSEDRNVGSTQRKLRQRKRRVSAPPERKTSSPRFPGNPRSRANEPRIQDAFKSLVEVMGKKQPGEAPVEDNVPLGMVIRKAVPFTACASTTRSHNVGLNLQQLLSLSKRHGKSNVRFPHSVKSQEGNEEGGAPCCRGMNARADRKRDVLVSWVPGSKSDGCDSDATHLESGDKVWMSKERTSSNFRKVRSKYTRRPPGGFVEYHKSTMSQYTNGQKSMIKSESKSAYAVGSKIMVSGCERTDVFEIEKGGHSFEKASGDGTCNRKCAKLSSEWAKVYSSFLSTYRKYASLKEKLSDKDLAPSNDELKFLENEIDHAIEKYKDFLQFYSKFLHLKHRLKSLKIACETKMIAPVTSFSSNCQRVEASRPTNSMVLKKAFKEVQALQHKIRLVSD